MKKILKKILVFAFIFTIASPTVLAYSPSNLPQNNKSITVAEDLFEDKKWLNEFEEYLSEELGDNYKEIIDTNWNSALAAEDIRNLFSKNRSGEIIYPEYIGGLYINDNNNLVIQIVDELLPNKKDSEYETYQEITAIPDTLITESVKYSYNELKAVTDYIEDYYRTNYSTKTYAIYNNVLTPIDSFTLGDNVESFYIDEFSNRVVVKLHNCTKSEIEEFKNTVIDSPMIEFEQAEKLINEHNPGGPLPATNTCSLGYRALVSSNTSVAGIMTAGHCSQTGGQVGTVIVDNSGSIFGTVWSWQNSDSIDAAFISVTHGQSVTNTLNRNATNTGTGPTLSTSVVSSFTSGQWIGKVGNKTGYSVGTVVNPSVTVSGFTNLVTADYNSTNGDSGGIVFGGSVNNYKTAGIHKGRYVSDNTAIFSKASVINSTFGLSRY